MVASRAVNIEINIEGLPQIKALLEDAHAEIERLREEILDGYLLMETLVQQSSDPGTGALAWLHRNSSLVYHDRETSQGS